MIRRRKIPKIRCRAVQELVPCLSICGGYVIVLAVVILLAFIHSYHEDEWSVNDIFALCDGLTFKLFGIESWWVHHQGS